jgi:hypothetical protein
VISDRLDVSATGSAAAASRAGRLAAAADDLACGLHRLAPSESRHALDLALTHLSHVVGLIPEAERPPFLFQCWERCLRDLGPAQRVALSRRAAAEADRILYDATARTMSDELRELWLGYRTVVAATLAAPTDDDSTPVNYLLFEHAHHAHRRLDIPLDIEAVAARVLRAATSCVLPEPMAEQLPARMLEAAGASAP